MITKRVKQTLSWVMTLEAAVSAGLSIPRWGTNVGHSQNLPVERKIGHFQSLVSRAKVSRQSTNKFEAATAATA